MEDGLAGCLGSSRDSELTGLLEAGKLQLSGMSTKQPWPLYSETTLVEG